MFPPGALPFLLRVRFFLPHHGRVPDSVRRKPLSRRGREAQVPVDLHRVGGAVDRHPAPAARCQIRLEQPAADALPVDRRIYEKQGDVALLRRQDAQESLPLLSAKCC